LYPLASTILSISYNS